MSNDFQLLCTISIHPKRNQILFSFRPDFPIITKIGTVKKNQNITKKMARSSEPAPKSKSGIVRNSTIRGVIHSN